MKKRKISIVSIAIFLLFSLLASTAVAWEWKIKIGDSSFILSSWSEDEVSVFLDNDARTFVGTYQLEEYEEEYEEYPSGGYYDFNSDRRVFFRLGGTLLYVELNSVFTDGTRVTEADLWPPGYLSGYLSTKHESQLFYGNGEFRVLLGTWNLYECEATCTGWIDDTDDCWMDAPISTPCSQLQ